MGASIGANKELKSLLLKLTVSTCTVSIRIIGSLEVCPVDNFKIPGLAELRVVGAIVDVAFGI